MKRYVKGAQSEALMTSSNGNFWLVNESGIGINDTPWTGLRVMSSDEAEEYVIEIRLDSKGFADFNGEPVHKTYRGAYIAHGMRSRVETLDETERYVELLQEAIDFARKINKALVDYLNTMM